MSMRSYGISMYGVVAKIEELNPEAFKQHFDISDEDWENEDWSIETLDRDGVFIQPKNALSSDLEGDFISYFNMYDDCGVDAMEDDWVLFDMPRYPQLFEAAYKNKTEYIAVMKETFSKFLLSSDFDWENRTVHLLASIWG